MAARLIIEGGVPLRGEVAASAAKNAALPALCAALLTARPVVLDERPRAGRRAHHAARCWSRPAATVATDADGEVTPRRERGHA